MIYHIFANKSNIGDWLSAKGIQKLLHPLKVTECLCDTSFVTDTMKKLSKANENDLIIIGGGGLIMDYFIPFWKAFKNITDKVPYVIWGIGCCDLKSKKTLPPLSLMKEIILKSNLCIVRDERTKMFFDNCNLKYSVPCPSINYINTFSEHGDGILHVNNYTTVGAYAYNYMRDRLQNYSQKNGCIYRETNNRIESGNLNSLEHVLLHYQKSGIVVSSALHGCIIAVAMGLKVIAVSGDAKIDEFMKSVALEEWLVNTNEVHLIEEKLKSIHQQKSQEKKLEEIRFKNSLVAKKVLELMKRYEYSDLVSDQII